MVAQLRENADSHCGGILPYAFRHVQRLLADWSAFTSSLTTLADQASSRAEALADAAGNLTLASSGTLTAMREAATWSSRLTEKYVAQIAMLEAITESSTGVYGCSRSAAGSIDAHFGISSSAVSSGSSLVANQGRRRQLLQQNSKDKPTDAAKLDEIIIDELQAWDGYSLGVEQKTTSGGAWGLEGAGLDTPERARWIGEAGRNRLVGGLFLHTTRKPVELSCKAGSYATKFALGCSKSALPLAKGLSASAVLGYLKQLFPGAGNDVYPYGVDPVFLRSSNLYEPSLVGSEGDFYNASDPAEVPAATGVPYGYFYRGLKVSKTLQKLTIQLASCGLITSANRS